MNKNSVLRLILILIVIGCFGYLIWYKVNQTVTRSKAKELSVMADEPVKAKSAGDILKSETVKYQVKTEDLVLEKYKNLYLKNKNLIGWIKIDDTIIDYPVMKSINGNGNFYLDHDYDGKEDRNGTLFMDDLCDPQGPSDNLIIYGHNMKSGQMFGNLDNYKSESFYKSHKTVKFDTIFREGVYEVAFVFQSKVYSEADITFKYYQFIEPNSAEEFDSGIRAMKEMSLYDTGVDAQYGDQLITLSTCDYDEANGRFVVVCKKVK